MLQYALSDSADRSRADAGSTGDWCAQLLPVLALISLLRLLSVVVPVQDIPQMYWYAMIGAPILAGTGLTARLAGLSMTPLGLRARFGFSQLAIAATGVPLGMIGYAILVPESVIGQFSWTGFAVGALIIIVFTGFLEEVLFRSVLQGLASRVLGNAAVLWSSTIFALMFLGTLSLPFVLFMGLVAFFFGWCFRRTGILWGIVVAHCLMNLGFLIVYPLFL
jgi:membrane protease YdiL (CAAX protease family)